MDSQENFINVSLSSLVKQPRQVFVAYSYVTYDKKDYRRAFDEVSKAFDIQFVFADEKISSPHILQKIANYIRESQFGIYDISSWNPNVTLELGLALGMGEQVLVALNPSKTEMSDVPSDLKGVDRLQYQSFSSLQEELERLMSQVLPPPKDEKAEGFLEDLQEKIVLQVQKTPKVGVATIAKAVGVNIELAKVAIRNELGVRLQSTSNRRGTKYSPL